MKLAIRSLDFYFLFSLWSSFLSAFNGFRFVKLWISCKEMVTDVVEVIQKCPGESRG